MIDYTIQFWRDDKATSDQNLNREFLRMKYHEARWKLVERNLLKTNFISKLIYIFSKTRFLEEKELLLLRSNKRVPTIHSTKSNEIISVYKQYLISPIILCHEKKKKKNQPSRLSNITRSGIFFVLKNVATAVRRNAISHPSVARLRSNFANLSRSRDINGRSENEISRLNFHGLHRHPRDMCRVARVCRLYEAGKWRESSRGERGKSDITCIIDNSMYYFICQTLFHHLHNADRSGLITTEYFKF